MQVPDCSIYVAATTKMILDVMLELQTMGYPIGILASRRQIDYNGGYVEYWTTKDFLAYIRKKNDRIMIARDHGGPLQGTENDDGLYSFEVDCHNFDIIHIDPWKNAKTLQDGTVQTLDLIEHCYRINPFCLFEIGTEEAIFPFSPDDLDFLISTLRNCLSQTAFANIYYVVIQCGTLIQDNKNKGVYDQAKLDDMNRICQKYKLVPKEHNSDFVPAATVKQKVKRGLRSLNLAPEFSALSNQIIADSVKKNDRNTYNMIYDMCFNSGQWKKWLSPDVDPSKNKDDIIVASLHYLISTKEFRALNCITSEIENSIKDKVKEHTLDYLKNFA